MPLAALPGKLKKDNVRAQKQDSLVAADAVNEVNEDLDMEARCPWNCGTVGPLRDFKNIGTKLNPNMICQPCASAHFCMGNYMRTLKPAQRQLLANVRNTNPQLWAEKIRAMRVTEDEFTPGITSRTRRVTSVEGRQRRLALAMWAAKVLVGVNAKSSRDSKHYPEQKWKSKYIAYFCKDDGIESQNEAQAKWDALLASTKNPGTLNGHPTLPFDLGKGTSIESTVSIQKCLENKDQILSDDDQCRALQDMADLSRMEGDSGKDFIRAILGGDEDIDSMIKTAQEQNRPVTNNVLGGAKELIENNGEDISAHLGLAAPMPFQVPAPKAKANKGGKKINKESEAICKISPVLAARQDITRHLKGFKAKYFNKKGNLRLKVKDELKANKYTLGEDQMQKLRDTMDEHLRVENQIEQLLKDIPRLDFETVDATNAEIEAIEKQLETARTALLALREDALKKVKGQSSEKKKQMFQANAIAQRTIDHFTSYIVPANLVHTLYTRFWITPVDNEGRILDPLGKFESDIAPVTIEDLATGNANPVEFFQSPRIFSPDVCPEICSAICQLGMEGPARSAFESAMKEANAVAKDKVSCQSNWKEDHFKMKDIEQNLSEGNWLKGPLKELAQACGPMTPIQTISWPFLRSTHNAIAYYKHVLPGHPLLYQVISVKCLFVVFPITEVIALGNPIGKFFSLVKQCTRQTFKDNFAPHFVIFEANPGDVVWVPAGHFLWTMAVADTPVAHHAMVVPFLNEGFLQKTLTLATRFNLVDNAYLSNERAKVIEAGNIEAQRRMLDEKHSGPLFAHFGH